LGSQGVSDYAESGLAGMKNLTRGSIVRHLTVLAAPIALGTLVQTSLLYVEGYFVARLGQSALAGMSASSTAIIVAYAMTQVVSVSAVTLVSHAVGRDSRQEATRMFNQSLSLAMFGMAFTLLAGYGFAGMYMRFLGADRQTAVAGVTFLIWTIPAFALQFPLAAMGSALRGTGIVNPTILVQTSTVILNAALDPVLISGSLTGHPLGLPGAGLARTIAAAVAVTALTVYFIRVERYVTFDIFQWRPDPVIWRRMVLLGLPAGGEFAVIALFITLLYWTLRDFGAAAQAGFGLGSRLLQGIFQPVMSITYPAVAIAGQNFGAKHFDRVRRTFAVTAMGVCVICAILATICQLYGGWMARQFTAIPEIVAVTTDFLRITSWNYVLLGLVFTCSSLFQSMGNTWPSLATSGWRLLAFFVPVLYLKGRSDFRLADVWYLMVASVVLEAAFALTLLHFQYRKHLHELPNRTFVYPA
jgi:putative MATE family efflux protein